jgi:uncharacterized protein YjbI with pentapeptide repeats
VVGVAVAGVLALGAQTAPAQEQEIGLLFAQTANRGTMKPIKGTPRFSLKLFGVNSQVVWFSDRPARQSGEIPVLDFTRSWAGFGFVDDPPNAALTVLNARDREDTVVVELRHPDLKRKKNRLRYTAEILDAATGNLSHLESDRDRRVRRHFRDPSLFIDDAAAPVLNGCVIQALTKCPGVDLTGADLSGAQLSLADLRGANLSGANLSGAIVDTADLTDAELNGANLTNASLQNIKLSEADLRGATLFSAELSDANLTVADLTGADLSQAYLAGADLSRALLSQAILGDADLTDANLSFASLLGADLRFAGLAGADLTGADLTGALFCQTRMPDGAVNNKDC